MLKAALLSALVPFVGAAAVPTRPPAVTCAPRGGGPSVGAEFIARGVDPAIVVTELLRWRDKFWPKWYARYADGTYATNSFRFYRTSDDVWMYFIGQPGSHDCDAVWVDPQGRRGRFCTRDAYAFTRAHGGIVDVGRM
ncbi:MAG TPA: hypothetical protein VKE69_07655 [Planctomycetota bacterium]|nr:hypothetical protein [Planctomycetota bacterium]